MPQVGVGWIMAATAAAVGSQVYTSRAQAGQAKKAAAHQASQQKKAAQDLKDSQAASAAQAQAAIDAKRRRMAGSESIYTSPLGIAGTADVARKTLLGH